MSVDFRSFILASTVLYLLLIKTGHLRGDLGIHSRETMACLTPSLSDDFALAFHESDGFFTDVRESDWKMLKDRISTTPSCQFDCSSEDAKAWYQNNWEPAFTCLHERRIGRWGDGGKWICDPHRIRHKASSDPCLVYSVGSKNDFSFEEAVMNDISMECEIHTFDPTIGENPSRLPNYGNTTFHPWGLSHKDEGAYKTMGTFVRDLQHEKREIDILKIDCEGCEWTSYSTWFDKDIIVRQILIELHGGVTSADHGNNSLSALKFMQHLQGLGYVIFHKEPNTLGCKGRCIEYGFLRLNIAKTT